MSRRQPPITGGDVAVFCIAGVAFVIWVLYLVLDCALGIALWAWFTTKGQ